MSTAKPLPVIPATSAARVLVVGDVMLDRYWFGEVNRISPEAPVPVVHVQRSEERPGGAANVARNAAALGAKVSLLSVVGNDEPAQALEKLLATDGVHTRLHRDPALSTTIKLRVLGRQQQLLRIDFENLPTHEILRNKLADFATLLPEHDVIVLSDYGKGGLAHIAEMIAMARAAGKTVLVDPKGDDYSKYSGASLLTPNRSELRQVVGQWRSEEDLVHKAQELRQSLDLDALLVTRSEEGMSLFRADGMVHEGTRAQEVFDVSGAGDTVIATLAVMLGAGCDLVDAMRLSNHAAGIVVAKLGTATVTLEEMLAE
ncbi:D-glycero-beta-D-manno-heptose-7-phosphate kinase [Uliginosibacterium aquaticum]|uniref:D-glycero-beta-D-manno-heptose-7-phosphate kinase n=1 Tax=Uliginosibacterium aquaticum TaxID=2731212 RepID=A0ABX2IDJ3_9RHOO|nr:D-glycero-beta-D-manno-heptose-7-phosphate kinase [Uliginosibacterium aquaticum]NSL54665.1 D-glycero-beta-D-manno-heptose-7-phosphate kinase [Uliginosibacterium aquaticum]